MIALLFFLNFAISCLNAWGCGKTWNETKHNGGFPHLLNWCGAIMSACGFTWCYSVLGVVVGTMWLHGKPPEPYVSPELATAFFQSIYLVIILPVLGSGLAITCNAWAIAYRQRSFGSGAIAAYDTFAQIYNITHAIRGIPKASSGVGDYFKSKDREGQATLLVLVVLALLAGVLTTRWIIRATAANAARDRAMKWEMERT